jgi:hypothetical protein
LANTENRLQAPYLLACSALSVVGHSWPRTTIFELLADWLRTTQDQQAHGDNPATRELIEFVSESKSWSELAQREQVEFVAFDVVDSR